MHDLPGIGMISVSDNVMLHKKVVFDINSYMELNTNIRNTEAAVQGHKSDPQP